MDKLAGRKTLKVGTILDEFEKDRLKAGIDIVELFGSFGVSLAPRGKGFIGKCPWHDDTTPSLSVDREKGLYNCFGCGESGDAFSLVQKMNGLDFKGALEYLKSRAGGAPGPATAPLQKERENQTSEPREAKVPVEAPIPAEPIDRARLLADLAERYAKNLAGSTEARGYLASRCLDVPELIASFGLGFSDGQLPSSLGQAQREALAELGILSATGREHFARCIVFPLRDERGQVAGFYGRSIDAAGKKPVHLYQKGPHEGLLNRDAAKVYRDGLVLAESVIDALSLYALGIRNMIPCYGANGFSKAHEALLRGERVERVYVAFDADEPGRAGARALVERLNSLGIVASAAEPPSGKDWNEYLCSGGTMEEAHRALERVAPEPIAEPAGPRLILSKESGRHVFTRGETKYRLTGVRDSFQASLRIGMRLEHAGRTYIDTVDLYSSRSRSGFAAAASQVGLESSRVEADLLIMLDVLEAERDERLFMREEGARELTDEERSLGLALLTDPHLPERIVADLTALGYVGEELNKLLVYLAASSRKLDDPVSVIVSSQSAAGKSYLIDTVKRLMPEEDVIAVTSLSDQALNYLPDDALLHKFLVMGEAVHSESVEHQIREMLSAKELARLVTMKDERTGDMTSKLVRKDVIVSMVMSTTRVDVNPENASRCFVIAADESEDQTKAIHESQRRKYSIERLSQRNEGRPAIIARHHAAQRLLRKIGIVNPLAAFVDFPAQAMRTRRDHERFLDLIACVAFLRQYQKTIMTDSAGNEYIECDLSDYGIAYRIMQAILPLTLSNFPAAAESLYESIRALVRDKAEAQELPVTEVEVSQREIREITGLSQMSVKRNVRTLVEYEFLVSMGVASRGFRRGYRLARDERLSLVDLSSIPSPEELSKKLGAAESGSTGATWGGTGLDKVFAR